MTIHKEGYTILAGTLAVLGLLNVISLFLFPGQPMILVPVMVISLIVFLLILQFFRYPKRDLTRGEKSVVCPADGKVVVIEKTVETEYFKDERLMISVFMSPNNLQQ